MLNELPETPAQNWPFGPASATVAGRAPNEPDTVPLTVPRCATDSSPGMLADRKSRLVAAGVPPPVTASAYGPCRPSRNGSVWAWPLNMYWVMLVVAPVL